MMKSLIAFCLILISNATDLCSQCANVANIYSFSVRGYNYEVVREKSTWENAAICAKERGGYLAEINDSLEHDSIFYHVINKANIIMSNTQNIFGTSAIWIGGTDVLQEGLWIWDGNNDGMGSPFWNGGPSGSPINGSFTKWGTSPAEPDNSGGQHHLCLTIDSRRINYGKWNDLKSNDNIYYLIEKNSTTNTNNTIKENLIKITPNPALDYIIVQNETSLNLVSMIIFNSVGQQELKKYNVLEQNFTFDITSLATGMYWAFFSFENGEQEIIKFVKL